MSTDVDYHTFMHTTLLVLGSLTEGVAERAANIGETIVTDTGQIIVKDDPSTKDLLISGFGKVGQRAAQAAIQNSNRPPTVILDGQEKGIVGLMMVEDFNPDWLPEIKENQVY